MNDKETDKTSLIKIQYKRPYIAYPTIILHYLALCGSLISLILGTSKMLLNTTAFELLEINTTNWYIKIPLTIFCLLLSTVSSYTQFTIAHDAIHRSVSKNKYLNDTIGHLAQFWLGPTSNYYALKYNHLNHHAYTNDIQKDPDIWCSSNGYGSF